MLRESGGHGVSGGPFPAPRKIRVLVHPGGGPVGGGTSGKGLVERTRRLTENERGAKGGSVQGQMAGGPPEIVKLAILRKELGRRVIKNQNFLLLNLLLIMLNAGLILYHIFVKN
jgi:hypothetical protein